jgi:hypothetical protein
MHVAIDWAKMSSIVQAFMEWITNSCTGPGSALAREWHNAFSVMAANWLPIDTLGQFEKAGSRPEAYTEFCLPVQFASLLPLAW